MLLLDQKDYAAKPQQSDLTQLAVTMAANIVLIISLAMVAVAMISYPAYFLQLVARYVGFSTWQDLLAHYIVNPLLLVLSHIWNILPWLLTSVLQMAGQALSYSMLFVSQMLPYMLTPLKMIPDVFYTLCKAAAQILAFLCNASCQAILGLANGPWSVISYLVSAPIRILFS